MLILALHKTEEAMNEAKRIILYNIHDLDIKLHQSMVLAQDVTDSASLFPENDDVATVIEGIIERLMDIQCILDDLDRDIRRRREQD